MVPVLPVVGHLRNRILRCSSRTRTQLSFTERTKHRIHRTRWVICWLGSRKGENAVYELRAKRSMTKTEHLRRMKIRLAALKRHARARNPVTGRSLLAESAGRASGRMREGDSAWGLELALQRWYPVVKVYGESQ